MAQLDADAAVDLIWKRLADEAAPHHKVKRVRFGTKAETLDSLAPHLQHARILPQVRFSVAQWRADRSDILSRVAAMPWGRETLIVRSSAKARMARRDPRQENINPFSTSEVTMHLLAAVESVIASFEDGGRR